ncbi:hypothetical protein C789_5355 [Microcystis aeruginosa FACHB-905 = DIANCHI905]|nr:hypothetical protein C789_5355 [Microcystis aeruginosa FACHB-905 = DIANCHI905]
MAKTLVLFFFGVGLDATWQFLLLSPPLHPTPHTLSPGKTFSAAPT